MFRIALLSWVVLLGQVASAQADVFIFNQDGSTTEYIAKDYLHKGQTAFQIPAPKKKLYSEYIQSSSQKYDVEIALIEAVIYVESGFNADAVSPKGAMGLMQLMPDTAGELGVSDPFDPASNIEGGVRYLSQLITENRGDTSLALAAYNRGQGAVNKYGGVPPYKETESYVDAVLMLVGQEGN